MASRAGYGVGDSTVGVNYAAQRSGPERASTQNSLHVEGSRQYFHRARDAGANPAVEYITWTSSSQDATYPGDPPFGGPLTDHVCRPLENRRATILDEDGGVVVAE